MMSNYLRSKSSIVVTMETKQNIKMIKVIVSVQFLSTKHDLDKVIFISCQIKDINQHEHSMRVPTLGLAAFRKF